MSTRKTLLRGATTMRCLTRAAITSLVAGAVITAVAAPAVAETTESTHSPTGVSYNHVAPNGTHVRLQPTTGGGVLVSGDAGTVLVTRDDGDVLVANDAGTDALPTCGILTCTVYLNKLETKDAANAGSLAITCAALGLIHPSLAIICGSQAGVIIFWALRAKERNQCIKIKYPTVIVVGTTVLVPQIYSGGYCT